MPIVQAADPSDDESAKSVQAVGRACKSEIQISKSETMPNAQKTIINNCLQYLNFELVYDFVLRASN
jgi:hypothetical protein